MDLLDRDFFRDKLAEIVRVKNKTLEEVYHDQGVSFEAIYQEYSSYGEQLRKFVTDTSVLVNRALQDGKKVPSKRIQPELVKDHFPPNYQKIWSRYYEMVGDGNTAPLLDGRGVAAGLTG